VRVATCNARCLLSCARKLGKRLVAQLLDRQEIGHQLRVEVVRRFHLSEGVAYDGLKHQQLALLG
jgi:hypothetical protein